MKTKINSKKNQNGSILVIMMMSVVIMMATMGMIFYSQNAANDFAKIKSKSDLSIETERIVQKILQIYSEPLANHSCDAALMQSAKEFKNFALITPTPFQKVAESKSTSLPEIKCLIEKQTSGFGLADILESYEINILPVNVANDAADTGQRRLRIELKLQKKKAMISKKIVREFIISLVTLDRFGVIITSDSAQKLTVSNNARIFFDSDVLHSQNSTPFNLNAFFNTDINNPKITFLQKFYSRAQEYTLSNAINYEFLNVVFEKGLQSNYLSYLNSFPTDNTTLWNHKIDYAPIFTDEFPLPDLNNGSKSSGYNTGSGIYNSIRANFATIPSQELDIDSLGAKPTQMSETCNVDDATNTSSVIKSLVLFKPQETFTIDFSSTSQQSAKAFCGLLYVKKLTVKLSNSHNHFLIGKFIFEELNVEGDGQLIFIDPDLSNKLSGRFISTLEAKLQNIAKLRQLLKNAQVTLAQPFTQPLTSEPNSLTVGYKPIWPAEWFESSLNSQIVPVEFISKPLPTDPNILAWPTKINSPRAVPSIRNALYQNEHDHLVFIAEEVL